METMKLQYTHPDTGLDFIEVVRFELSKYRKDESLFPTENFFLTSTVNTEVDSAREVPDLIEAALVANPLNPYGCSEYKVTFGLVKYVPSTNSLVLTHNPQTLGFVVGVPIAILRNYADRNPVCYLIPNLVTTTALEFPIADSISTKGIKENYVAVQLNLPIAYTTAFTKEDKDWGVKSLLERPAAPTIEAVAEGSTIKITITPSVSNVYVVKKYNVYVISASNETFDMAMPVINGNRKPDLVLTPGDMTSKPITSWGGGSNAGGGPLSTGSTYYVVAVAKDYDTDMVVNVSALSNIDYVAL